MELFYSALNKLLNVISHLFQEKNWEIVEMTRARVDQFRRTVPLITDLKNKAMRLRHWDEIMVRYGLHDCSLTSTLCLGLVSLGFFFSI